MIRRAGAVFLLIAMAATGCRRSTIEIVAGAPDALIKKGSAKMAVKSISTVRFGAQEFRFEFAGDGAMDFTNRRGRFLYSSTSRGLGTESDRREEVLYDGSFVYFTAPPCPNGALGDKPWVRYDNKQAAAVDPSSAAGGNPSSLLDYLRGGGDVEEVAKEPVRGVETTHYRVRIDIEKVLDQLKGERRKEAQALLEEAKETETTADAWIDNDGLPRRFEMAFDVSVEGSVEVVTTMELFDYGTEVDVEIPPDDQVFTVESRQAITSLCSTAGSLPPPSGY